MAQKINSKKRILFLITQSEWGGAQQFLYQLISNLDKSRFEVNLATGSDGGGELTKMLGNDVQTVTIKNLKRDPSILSDIKSLYEIRDILNDVQPNILFLNSSKAGFNGSLVTRFFKLKISKPRVIYRIGGWTFNDPWPFYKKIFYFLLEWISASWKNVIVLNNKHDLKQAKKYGIRPQDLILIPNGLDKKSLDFLSRTQARSKLSQLGHRIDNNKIILGTIANFYPTKGLAYLIRAVSLLKNTSDFQLIIIGDGQQRMMLESLIKQKKLTNIILAGRLDNAYRYLKAFDIFVLASVKEGFPWTILEAMQARLPIIATRVGAIPEIIDHNRSGLLIPARDAEALAQAINSLTDSSKREELAKQALLKVNQDFKLDSMINSYENLFK